MRHQAQLLFPRIIQIAFARSGAPKGTIVESRCGAVGEVRPICFRPFRLPVPQ